MSFIVEGIAYLESKPLVRFATVPALDRRLRRVRSRDPTVGSVERIGMGATRYGSRRTRPAGSAAT